MIKWRLIISIKRETTIYKMIKLMSVMLRNTLKTILIYQAIWGNFWEFVGTITKISETLRASTTGQHTQICTDSV